MAKNYFVKWLKIILRNGQIVHPQTYVFFTKTAKSIIWANGNGADKHEPHCIFRRNGQN